MAAGETRVVSYKDEDVPSLLRPLAPDGIDLVIDLAFEQNAVSHAKVLSAGAGVSAYGRVDQLVHLLMRNLMKANALIDFILLYTLPRALLTEAAQQVNEAAANGAVSSLPEHHFALDDIAEAHEAVENGVTGKVIIDL